MKINTPSIFLQQQGKLVVVPSNIKKGIKQMSGREYEEFQILL